jgi:predicted RNase H-like HicB family nuclease
MLKKLLSFQVIYQEDPDGGFVATVAGLPGCHTQGETVEETKENIKEAIDVYLECLKDNRGKVRTKSPAVYLGTVTVNA